jgi:lipoyl(octanoyl) transferase
MATDSELASSIAEGAAPHTLRCYTWCGPSITLGHAQHADDFLDVARCETDNVEIAVRPTGGRAVFHDHDLAFSFTCHADDPIFGGPVRQTIHAVRTFLGTVFESLGVALDDESPVVSHSTGSSVGVSCFAHAVHGECQVDGRKIAGIAQRRYRSVILVQGTILTTGGFERLADYLADRDAGDRYREILRHRATSISAVTGMTRDSGCVVAAMKTAFMNSLGGAPSFDGQAEPAHDRHTSSYA